MIRFAQLLVLIFSLGPIVLPAQDIETLRKEFESYKKQQDQTMSDFKDSQQRSMDSLRAAANAAFAELLRGEWELKSTLRTPGAYTKPKPKDPPSNQGAAVPKEIPVPRPPEKNKDPESTRPGPARLADQLERDFSNQLILNRRKFFSQTILYSDVSTQWPKATRPVNEQSISNYFTACSSKPVARSMELMEYQKKAFRMNDWTFQLLVNQWAESNFPDPTDQRLFTWFMLIQHGYDVRLFYDNRAVAIGYAMDQLIYGKVYIEMEGKKYCILQEGPTSYFTYPKQSKMANRTFQLAETSQVNLNGPSMGRSVQFSHGGKKYQFTLPYDGARLDLYRSVPQTVFEFYLNESGHPDFRKSVREILAPHVEQFPAAIDKVRFLHSLVTYGIPYKTDDEQFGYEKFCLPEEALHYPYADCEDRSFLLSYLVRELVGLRTVALHLPMHLALAVEIPNAPAHMARIRYGNRDYIYCDPAFFGSDIGIMPDRYKNLSPVVHGGTE